MFAKNYINASIFVILSFISLGFAQFNDTQITYEYNENRIRDYETYILDDFTEKIKKYYDISNFSYELNDLNLNLKIHFIFDEISFSGEDNYNAISCQFIISNSSDQFYYIKNIKFPFRKGTSIYLNETAYDPLASIFDFYAFLFIGYELDSYELFLGDYYYSKASETVSLAGSRSGWDLRLDKIKDIRNNQYLRTSRYLFFKCLDFINENENFNSEVLYNSINELLTNFKLIHERIGYEKNTLKFIDEYKNEIIELFNMIKLDEGINFLYNYDDKNKELYKKYLMR